MFVKLSMFVKPSSDDTSSVYAGFLQIVFLNHGTSHHCSRLNCSHWKWVTSLSTLLGPSLQLHQVCHIIFNLLFTTALKHEPNGVYGMTLSTREVHFNFWTQFTPSMECPSGAVKRRWGGTPLGTVEPGYFCEITISKGLFEDLEGVCYFGSNSQNKIQFGRN